MGEVEFTFFALGKCVGVEGFGVGVDGYWMS